MKKKTLVPSSKISITNKSLKRISEKRGRRRRNIRSWLPWAAARRRMLLFAPETRALWDLVAGLRLLVGVLPSGVPLPLSFSLSTLSLSLAPEGGIASNICSMLENPGAQIEADLVFRRRELSDILRAIPSTISSPKTFPRPTPSFARKNLPVSVSLPLLLSPMYSLYFLKRKKKKSTTNSSPPPWEFLLSIHFQFIVSLLLLLLLEVNTWSSFLWFTFSSLLETRFERRFVEKLSGGTISSAGGFLIVPRVRVGERRRWRRGVFPPRFLPPLPRFRRGSIKSFDTVGTRWTIRGKVASTTGESSNSVKKQHVARSQSWIVATLSFASDFERDLDYLKDNTIYNKTNKFFF